MRTRYRAINAHLNQWMAIATGALVSGIGTQFLVMGTIALYAAWIDGYDAPGLALGAIASVAGGLCLSTGIVMAFRLVLSRPAA